MWGAIKHHFVICWLDWVTGFVRPPFKIWLRILEVLSTDLVLLYPNRPRFLLGTAPSQGLISPLSLSQIQGFSNFNMLATYSILIRLVLVISCTYFHSFSSGNARPNASATRPCFPAAAVPNLSLQRTSCIGDTQHGVSGRGIRLLRRRFRLLRNQPRHEFFKYDVNPACARGQSTQ